MNQQGAAGAGTPGPISVTYKSPDNTNGVTEDFDLLVVACDPNLLPFKNEPNGGAAVFSKLQHFQIHCTLLEVHPKEHPVNHGIVLSPQAVLDMKGTIFGFRNETAKQYGLAKAQTMETNLVAVYQLRDPWLTADHEDWSQDEFFSVMKTELPSLDWWPYGKDFQLSSIVPYTTDYFDHFSAEDLAAGLPWDIIDLQGKKSTFYVHASTCFESALHCWQYANMLFDPKKGLGLKLPEDLKSRILIVGAGVSGLLFAEKLYALKYENVTVMETLPDRNNAKTDLYGKTQTHLLGDGVNQTEPTVAELGTCYLSVVYDEFADYLEKNYVTNGNKRRGFEVGAPSKYEFRGMVVPLDLTKYAGQTLNFTDYVIVRAQQKMKWEISLDPISKDAMKVEILLAALRYWDKMPKAFGCQTPMPHEKPEADLAQLTMPFEQYLMDNDMAALVGVMEYAYSVQGYGPLTTIPTYYGMVWISDRLAIKMAWEEMEGKNLITYWSLGWGDVWRQMVEKIQSNGAVKIRYGIEISAVDRSAAV